MTQTSAFHFESLVWDWPIAIYLFLIGISAGLVTLAVLLRRFYPQAGGADSTLLRTTLIVGPGAVILGLLILVFHLTRPWTFWKLMFHYSFTSVMSMGVMLFQLYMVVLVLWLAKIFEHDLLALQQRWLPKLGIVQKVLSLLTPVHRGLETLMLVLAVLLGAYTGFLLSALKSYPFLNNPILPVLFLFSGISSGAAVALIAMAIRQRSNPHSTEAHFVHRMEIPVVWGEIFLLVAFFVGLALGDDGKVRALATVLYYQASQHMTVQARAMIDKALALDSNEITALMLLASDAFMQANYAQAIELWQKVMDLNSPRINRTQLVESINMAKLLQRRSD
ncbi:cytochrome c nitrite reductase subunit NrfD [Escherichia coli]|nr:cytochrome c nitrite reductase subunit NrfD [Escherichia coli]